jgi:hypothetical protein
LNDLARLRPTRKLAAHIARIDGAGQQEASFEDWLSGRMQNKIIKFHGIIMPQMANYYNEISVSPYGAESRQ